MNEERKGRERVLFLEWVAEKGESAAKPPPCSLSIIHPTPGREEE
jgi:hypothetical protein